MIAGNIYGIPYSALQSRLKGKPFEDSSLFYELGMLVAGILCLPVAIVRGLLGLSNDRFNKSSTDEQSESV